MKQSVIELRIPLYTVMPLNSRNTGLWLFIRRSKVPACIRLPKRRISFAIGRSRTSVVSISEWKWAVPTTTWPRCWEVPNRCSPNWARRIERRIRTANYPRQSSQSERQGRRMWLEKPSILAPPPSNSQIAFRLSLEIRWEWKCLISWPMNIFI